MKLSLVKVDNVPLSEKVAEQIILHIRENRMQKGERLPNEKKLIEQLNVSRTTIREAMRILSSRGIVVIRQGSGTYISGLPGVTEDPFGLQFKYDKEKVLMDLLELRFIMEPSIASYSAQRAGEEDVQEICKLANQVSECIKAGVNHIEQDVAFHCKIAQSAGNDILNVLFSEIVKGIRLFTTLLGDRIINEVATHHERIAQSISQGDAQGAYDAMLEHLHSNKKAIEDYLKQIKNKEREMQK
ncbi:MAG: Pyruvate dehydrogenase complex repressor [Firmicutes bacterium ADurb.Bin182]|nr:MAG: Pyruvate dehydrogenase complex repressor [Firmicutes bacterium ADurb.Bin182]